MAHTAFSFIVSQPIFIAFEETLTCNTREKSSARLSPRLHRRRESSHKRHLFVVNSSLDKHMQNEKELIRLRRHCGAFCLRRELPEPAGTRNFACGANYPHQALKGGYFLLCVGSS